MKFGTWLIKKEELEVKTPVITQLYNFITKANSRQFGNNQWLEDDIMQVYVRKATRLIENELKTTLDIANIEVYDKGKGTGSQFFNEAHKINPWQATYFENVLNPRLGKFLLANGYKQDSSMPPSYYKLKL
jgi:hypothetical protein